jgi:hypothetical protein
MRAAAIIFSQAASRVGLSFQMIPPTATVSPGSAFTALRKSVSLPSGVSSPQVSTTARAPNSYATA